MKEKGLILPLVLVIVVLGVVVVGAVAYFQLKPELTTQSQSTQVSTPKTPSPVLDSSPTQEFSMLEVTIKDAPSELILNSNGSKPVKQELEGNIVITIPIKTNKVPDVEEVQVIVTFTKQNPSVKNLVCDMSDTKDKCAVYLTWQGIHNEYDFRSGKTELSFVDSGFIEGKLDVGEYYNYATADAYIKGTFRLRI